MNSSIASVTVAYAADLPRQLEALLRQTRPLEEIIVVDNTSADGTAEMLARRYPQVKHLRLASNKGTGGGYSAGLEYAVLQKKYDWAWLLDDDSVPAPDALEKLLEAGEAIAAAGDRIGVLASLPVDSNSGQMLTGWLWQGEMVKPGPDVLGNRYWFVDAVISSGSLVGREAVEQVGLLRADFFIDFVDFEYCLRLRQRGYKVVIVPESRLHHELGKARPVKFLGRSQAWTERPPLREYYMWRNLTFLMWHLYPMSRSKFYLLRKLLRHASGVVLFNQEKQMCLRRMGLGVWDGLRGRLGIRFQEEPPKGGQDGPAQRTPAEPGGSSGPATVRS